MIPKVTISLERIKDDSGYMHQVLVASTVFEDDERFFYADGGVLMRETFDDEGNATGWEPVELNPLKLMHDPFNGWHDEVRYVTGLLLHAHAWATLTGVM